MHRFIISQNLDADIVLLQDKEIIRQINDVLKMKSGEEVALCDGRGKEAVGEILGIQKNRVEVKIAGESKVGVSNTGREVKLYCAILKRDNFEWVAQKATEVGVAEIVPIMTERTVKTGLARPRLQKIIKEAGEQSGRKILPLLREPVNFEDTLQGGEETKIFFDFCDKKFDGFFLGAEKDRTIKIFIGPEGGWTARERKMAEEAGCLVRSLGSLTLRAETAAVIAAYLATQMSS